METDYVANIPEDGESALAACRQFATSGCDVVLGTSYGYMDAMVACSQEFPQKKFLHVSGFKTTKNLNTAFARIYEGRYATGVLAGLTESKLGYVAAFPIPEVISGASTTQHHPRHTKWQGRAFAPWLRPSCCPLSSQVALLGQVSTHSLLGLAL